MLRVNEMEEINLEGLRQEVIDFLQTNRKMVLATCAGGRVTARTVSTINDGLKIFFQADRDSVKCRQIQQNSNVALACGNIQIEGKARITCHPLENSFFRENYRRHHESAFRRYSQIKDEVIIEVEPTLITFWKYDSEQKPFREYLLPGEKKAYREYYKKALS
jgi:general stress protein 26